jgi:hypothetical protein
LRTTAPEKHERMKPPPSRRSHREAAAVRERINMGSHRLVSTHLEAAVTRARNISASEEAADELK